MNIHYKNQDSVFFTFVRQFEIENNLASDTLQSNKSISLEHSENAANLLKHIASIKNNMTDSANLIKTYNKIFNGLNLTTKALVAANLADESLKGYGLAQGLDVTQAYSLLNKTMNSGTTMKMEDNITMPSGSPNQALNLANKHLISQANFGTSTMIAK